MSRGHLALTSSPFAFDVLEPPGVRDDATELDGSELHSFARDGVLVLKQAVPQWPEACALVHRELGRPGAVIDGGALDDMSMKPFSK